MDREGEREVWTREAKSRVESRDGEWNSRVKWR